MKTITALSLTVTSIIFMSGPSQALPPLPAQLVNKVVNKARQVPKAVKEVTNNPMGEKVKRAGEAVGKQCVTDALKGQRCFNQQAGQ